MNSETFKLANSSLMLILCAIPILIIAIQAIIFLTRALKEAANLGITKEVRKGVVLNSAVFSIVPSLPIIIIMAVLMPALGKYLPWLRLSVVGSAMYENMAADITVKSFGLYGVADPGLTPSIFLSVVWVMTLGVIGYPIANILFLKGYDRGIKRAQKKGGFAELAIPALFIGLMGVFGAPYLVNFKNPAAIVTIIISAIFVFIFEGAAKKLNQKWLKDFAFPLSMVIGMASAVIFDKIFT